MSKLSITIDGYSYEVELDLASMLDGEVEVQVDGQRLPVALPDAEISKEKTSRFIVAGRPYEIQLDADQGWLRSRWGLHQLEVHDLEITLERPPVGDGRIKAPIPGQITRVMVSPGDLVETGQPLLILEAMKMENEVRATCAGQVKSLNVALGQRVSLHQLLLEID